MPCNIHPNQKQISGSASEVCKVHNNKNGRGCRSAKCPERHGSSQRKHELICSLQSNKRVLGESEMVSDMEAVNSVKQEGKCDKDSQEKVPRKSSSPEHQTTKSSAANAPACSSRVCASPSSIKIVPSVKSGLPRSPLCRGSPTSHLSARGRQRKPAVPSSCLQCQFTNKAKSGLCIPNKDTSPICCQPNRSCIPSKEKGNPKRCKGERSILPKESVTCSQTDAGSKSKRLPTCPLPIIPSFSASSILNNTPIMKSPSRRTNMKNLVNEVPENKSEIEAIMERLDRLYQMERQTACKELHNFKEKHCKCENDQVKILSTMVSKGVSYNCLRLQLDIMEAAEISITDAQKDIKQECSDSTDNSICKNENKNSNVCDEKVKISSECTASKTNLNVCEELSKFQSNASDELEESGHEEITIQTQFTAGNKPITLRYYGTTKSNKK